MRTPDIVARAVVARMGTKMAGGSDISGNLLTSSIAEEVGAYRLEIAKDVADKVLKFKGLKAKERKALAADLDAVFGGG